MERHLRSHSNCLRQKGRLPAIALAASLIICFFWFKACRRVRQEPAEGNTATYSVLINHVAEPVTNTVSLATAQRESDSSENEVVGIGAALVRPNVANGVVQIDRVLVGSPAQRAGLRSGMNIHKVDGIAILRLPLSESAQLIRGPAGTKVRLEMSEGLNGEIFTVELTREKLEL